MALTSTPAPTLRAAIKPNTIAVGLNRDVVTEPALKRPFYVLLASLMLLVSAPAWAAIAVAIKLEDRGPVFYRQERWGRGQTRFLVLKFRSMIIQSDLRQATSGDKRITR